MPKIPGLETDVAIKIKTIDDDERTMCGNFAHIAGYTPGGVPSGATWEEVGTPPPWES